MKKVASNESMATVGHGRPTTPAGFEARPWVWRFWLFGIQGVSGFYCFNLLLCSRFNFLHLIKCQDEIRNCKILLLHINHIEGALNKKKKKKKKE
jgi:hypothetical protein